MHLIEKWYPKRFELFFISQITILFGSLIIPGELFVKIVSPLFFIINLFAGGILLSKNDRLKNLTWSLLVVILIIFLRSVFQQTIYDDWDYARMGVYFLFYVIVSYEMIQQVWRATIVNKNVIIGLISGYVSLGLIGFFICLTIEMAAPGSFHGLLTLSFEAKTESLMYYSYITLMAVGYGDVYPTTQIAHKAAVLIGLVGQLYLVIITAIVVGKYLNQMAVKKD